MNPTEHPFEPSALIALYLRDSGGDEQDLSTEQQERVLREWAATHGLRVGKLFSDSVTGTSTKGRTEFLRMMRYFQHDPPERGILIWRSNRFGRNIDDTQYFKADLRRRGYPVHSISDNIPEGPMGRFIEFALDWKDEIFSAQLSEDVQRGLTDLVRNYGALPGTPPRGFLRVPLKLGTRRSGEPHLVHKWEPDPATLGTIQRAFEMRANGATLRVIQAETHLYKSHNCWVTFFSNPLYKGELHYGDLVIPNYCAAIVTPEVWQAANLTGQLRRHVKSHQSQARRLVSSFLLSGLAYCGQCGALLTGKVIKQWRYYACSKRMAQDACDARQIPAEQLEAQVTQELLDHILTLENLLNINSRLADEYKATLEDLTARHSDLTRRLATVTRGIGHLLAALRQTGPSEAITTDLREQETQATELRFRISQLEKQLIPPPSLSTTTLAETAQHLTTILTTADLPTRRYHLQTFIHKISLYRDTDAIRGCIQYYPPFVRNS